MVVNGNVCVNPKFEHLFSLQINFYISSVLFFSVGPFILLEYCVHGQLNDYLLEMRKSLNVETMENLFRFGIGVARGMEYLSGKNVG